jgi:hypothetical protein
MIWTTISLVIKTLAYFCIEMMTAFYVWGTDDKFLEYHNLNVVEDFFHNEYEQRGYCHRAIFADALTNYKDINGQYIYTGDVINIDMPDGFHNTLHLPHTET